MPTLKSFCLLALLGLLSLPAFAADDLQAGKQLFSTPLGSNGKSCITCHAEGKGLQHADDYNSEQLRGIINSCIHKALQGKLLPDDDPRLAELERYVRSLKK